jgi:hypothetical protein
MKGEIVRYPRGTSKDHGEGEHMVSVGMGGTGAIEGTDQRAILDCVAGLTKDLVTKSLDSMKQDFGKR